MYNKILFGKMPDGQEVYKYTLTNSNGFKAEVTNYGAILLKLYVSDKNGELRDVVLGYDKLEDYFVNGSCFGATVGRNANRIAEGEFSINGVKYTLDKNDGPNNLHSGHNMYFNRVWDTVECSKDTVVFSIESKDMDQGFPGNAHIEVTYTLTNDDELVIRYHGVSDKATVFNMTNHSYFNLNGHNKGDILNHEVKIFSDRITNTDSRLIPDGVMLDIAGTPCDFREFKKIGKDIEADYKPLEYGNGYDQNYEIKGYDGDIKLAAILKSDNSDVVMEVYTDLPGIQMYTGNYINEVNCKENASYGKYAGVALETQYFPDAVNHDNFVSPVYEANEDYDTVTIYKFM